MSLPSYSDLKLWVGTLFSRQDWDYNFKKIVDWFSDGSADLVVGSIKAPNGIDMDGGKITNIGAATSGSDAVNLDTAQTLLNRSSYYYLFSVASGKEDASGNSAFLQKDSDVQATVLAGGVNPDLVICQSDGTVESLTSNTVLTIAAADDTYYIVKEKGQAPVVTSGKVDIGKVLPTSDITAGDYFLDNSTIPFKGYKYDAVSGWVETPFCLLGTVEKVSGTATCKSVKYNDNKFDLNVYNAGFMPDFSRSITITDRDGLPFPFTAPSDGWILTAIGASGGNGRMKIDNHDVGIMGGDDGTYGGFLVPVSKGQVVSGNRWGSWNVTFYPCVSSN